MEPPGARVRMSRLVRDVEPEDPAFLVDPSTTRCQHLLSGGAPSSASQMASQLQGAGWGCLPLGDAGNVGWLRGHAWDEERYD
ncbi:hypothetical protein AAY473_031456 [Plecturocebus cupreus]